MRRAHPMPRNLGGEVTGQVPWPRWMVFKRGSWWYAWGPTTIGGTACHPDDKAFPTLTEALAWATDKANEASRDNLDQRANQPHTETEKR